MTSVTVSVPPKLQNNTFHQSGKKETREKLTNTQVKLNSPPICCLTFLPKVTFSKHFLLVNEIFIAQLVVFQLLFGYIDLLVSKLER